ncbi:MAG: hypothetical protein MJY53_01355 [Bacteroidales bacterium]|nr:hypothetical protein [Bacteroidales bacterium]
MNRIFRIFVSLAAAVSLLSCSKEKFAGGEDFYEVRIEMNGFSDGENRILGFRSSSLFIEGFEPGESYFNAVIDGKSNEYFLLNLEFPDINTARVGWKLNLLHFNFANALINSGNGFTSEYSGSVFLAERTEKEAVLFFDRLKCNIMNTDFTFDGYVRCPLRDKLFPVPESHIFEYSPKSFVLSSDAQRFEVNFIADYDFTVLIPFESKGWLQRVEKSSEKYVFEISENEGKEARETNILVHDDALIHQGYEHINVRQAGRN